MTDELMKQLLEAGVHFGHQTKRWNPKMEKYIFGERSGIYIIDLEKTVDSLNQARSFLKDLTSKGGIVLFVGTKKQAQDVIEAEARRAEMFFVNKRWLGGLMTNFQTVRKSINRLKEIEKMKQDGIFNNLTKKEVIRLTKEAQKLERNLSGIKEMTHLPQAIFVVDSKKEEIAVSEANRLSIPIVGLIDTNCNPEKIDFVIPGNDDAMKSIKLITSLIAESIIEGRQKFKEGKLAQVPTVKEEALTVTQDLPLQDLPLEEVELLESVETEDEKGKKPPIIPKAKPKKAKVETKEEE
ncbi:MAG: 30S ribosomal protein S2 [Candidatus Omnitrophota bacterium]|nr:30S ribosomal protein S2 [Candidatus Omnitrophota bacterium]